MSERIYLATVEDEAGTIPAERLPASVVNNSAVVDLCAAPYNCLPELTDCTTAIQSAVNLIAEKKASIWYFSKTARYLVGGPQKTGEAFGYKYSGQILYPARTVAEGQLLIHAKGAASPTKPLLGSTGDEKTQEVTGSVLVSNATSGNVFDVIPAFETNGVPFSDLLPIFEDIVVQTPSNPQCGGINMSAAKCFQQKGALRIEGPGETEGGIDQTETPLTGSGVGLSLPKLGNGGNIKLENTTIHGFPTALGISEHLVGSQIFIGTCNKAIECYGLGHANHFGYVSVEECETVLYSPNSTKHGALIYGLIDHENLGSSTLYSTPGNFIEDPLSEIHGKIMLKYTAATANSGYPVVGGQNLDVEFLEQGAGQQGVGVGWKNTFPIDNFLRSAIVAGNLGCATNTAHPWRIVLGSFTSENKGTFGLVKLEKNELSQATVRVPIQGTGSRVIRAELTPSATGSVANVGVTVGGNTSTGSGLWVRLREGKVQLLGTKGTVVDEATQAGGSLLALAVVVNYPLYRGAPTSVVVYVGETEKFTYNLTTEERAEMLAPITQFYFEDGIKNNKDMESTIQHFEVQPLT